MAKRPPTETERNANLDALETAVNKWGKTEQDRLENEVKFMRSVLKGRTGSEKAGTKNLDLVSDLLQAEIDDFIEFGSDAKRRLVQGPV